MTAGRMVDGVADRRTTEEVSRRPGDAQAASDAGWELFRLMLDVASGRRKTWAEHGKLHNALVLFNPAPVT